MLRNRSSCSAARAACILSSKPRAAVCILVAACWPPATCSITVTNHTCRAVPRKLERGGAYMFESTDALLARCFKKGDVPESWLWLSHLTEALSCHPPHRYWQKGFPAQQEHQRDAQNTSDPPNGWCFHLALLCRCQLPGVRHGTSVASSLSSTVLFNSACRCMMW